MARPASLPSVLRHALFLALVVGAVGSPAIARADTRLTLRSSLLPQVAQRNLHLDSPGEWSQQLVAWSTHRPERLESPAETALSRMMAPGRAMLAGRSYRLTPFAHRNLFLDVHVGVRQDLFSVAPFLAAGLTSELRWQWQSLALLLDASACGDGVVALLKGFGTDSVAVHAGVKFAL